MAGVTTLVLIDMSPTVTCDSGRSRVESHVVAVQQEVGREADSKRNIVAADSLKLFTKTFFFFFERLGHTATRSAD